jgi:hypothetical protein
LPLFKIETLDVCSHFSVSFLDEVFAVCTFSLVGVPHMGHASDMADIWQPHFLHVMYSTSYLILVETLLVINRMILCTARDNTITNRNQLFSKVLEENNDNTNSIAPNMENSTCNDILKPSFNVTTFKQNNNAVVATITKLLTNKLNTS